jgi:hypothetical protein
MERSGKQNEDGAKSRKVEERIRNAGRGRGISMTGSRNVEVNWESLRSLDVAGVTSAEGQEGQGMSSAGGDPADEGGRHADHLTPQFMIIIQKNYIGDISRTEARMGARN